MRLNRNYIRGILLLGFAALIAALSTTTTMAESGGFAGVCDNGAPAREQQYCHFFEYFRSTANTLDHRLADNLGVKDADDTRSIGLIIAIDKYPNQQDISAAKVDGDNLTQFLINDQQFDEVIVLRNSDATVSNINYFLLDYLVNRALDYHKKARLLIAYSGHGRPQNGAEKAAFLLSDIKIVDGSDFIFPMDEFSSDVDQLAKNYFQILTLINACYGGNIFTMTMSGGNADTTTSPGSYAITAGDNQHEVPALLPQRGSLFFDLIVDGVRRGVADTSYWEFFAAFDEKGRPIKRDGLTRTGALGNYLASAYAKINQLRPHVDLGFKTLATPWIGPAEKDVAQGGFFFLTDAEIGSPTDLAFAYGHATPPPIAVAENRTGTQSQSFSVPPGPVSSIKGMPGIKIFKQPGVYPVHGYDLSSQDGAVDWKDFVNANHPRFVYARAFGWRGVDSTFNDRLSNLIHYHVDHGAYLKYNFCVSPAGQFERLKAKVPSSPDTLPIAIELVTPSADQDRTQGLDELPCYQHVGVEKARQDILSLVRHVQDHYRKTPVIFGNRYNLQILTDSRFNDYMIWLAAYNATGNRLRGTNPWTLWQYGTEDVKGVGAGTTVDVFFGTEEQYASFKEGKGNIARQAVTQ